MKKLLSVLLALTMVIAMGSTAFAAPATHSGEVTIVNLAEDISAQSIAEIKESVSASFVSDDGVALPVDTVVTIEELPTPRSRLFGAADAKTYEVTVTASTVKTSHDYEYVDKGGAEAELRLGMQWTDVTGFDNTLDVVWCERAVYSGTIKGSTLRAYSSKDDTEAIQLSSNPNDWYYEIFPDFVGLHFQANYRVVFTNVGTFALAVSN